MPSDDTSSPPCSARPRANSRCRSCRTRRATLHGSSSEFLQELPYGSAISSRRSTSLFRSCNVSSVSPGLDPYGLLGEDRPVVGLLSARYTVQPVTLTPCDARRTVCQPLNAGNRAGWVLTMLSGKAKRPGLGTTVPKPAHDDQLGGRRSQAGRPAGRCSRRDRSPWRSPCARGARPGRCLSLATCRARDTYGRREHEGDRQLVSSIAQEVPVPRHEHPDADVHTRVVLAGRGAARGSGFRHSRARLAKLGFEATRACRHPTAFLGLPCSW